MSGTILKVTITAFCVQGEVVWVVVQFNSSPFIPSRGQECPPHTKLWETMSMPKRNLRIVKRVKNVPVIGICESCKVQFQAEHQPAGQQSRAQAVIQQQFNAHKCQPEPVRQAGHGSS